MHSFIKSTCSISESCSTIGTTMPHGTTTIGDKNSIAALFATSTRPGKSKRFATPPRSKLSSGGATKDTTTFEKKGMSLIRGRSFILKSYR